jgi:Ser/Thr protein kinase RdoA (MazF antagonist)
MVTGSDRDDVLALLSAVPALAGIAPASIRVSPLGGFSHTNLKLETPVGDFVLQIPVPDPHAPGRAQAIEATRRASELGIGAALVHANPTTGILVTRWVAGAEELSPERFRRDPRFLGEVAGLLRRWHRSGERLGPAIDHFDAIARLRAALLAPLGSARLEKALKSARTERDAQASLAPIHGDPALENLLWTPDGFVLIDWEYAGMGDPAWDLGYLALANDLSPAGEAALVAAYGDPELTVRRLRVSRLIAAALSALWFAVRARREDSPDLSIWVQPRLRQAEQLSAELYPDAGSG